MQNQIEEAKRLKEQGQLDEAIATLKRVIDLDLDNAEAYLELGLAYFEQQDYRQALKVLRVAAGLWPSSGLIHYHLGLAYHALGDQAGVSSIHGALIIIDPDMARRLADDTAQNEP
ncbi:MAG TPA: tetratricopeptide repeat protein [Blastocatellia bacterium]|nr:tetratricopeptide repeat protein [Blastocatellia bacterium]